MDTLTSAQQALVNSAKAGHPVTIDQMTAAGFTLSTFNTAVMGVDNGAATAQAASSTPSTPSTSVTPVAPTQALSATQQASNAIQQLQTYGPEEYNTLQTAGLLDQLQQQMISSNNFDAGTLANNLIATYQQQQAAAQQQAAQQAAAAQAAQVAAQQAAQAQQQALVNTANTAYSTLQNNVTQANLDAYNAAAKAAGITPADTSTYQAQITQQAALQTAEANFKLPAGNDSSTTAQTTTDPMGSTYTYVPADPATGSAGQWYKDTGGGAMQAVNANGQPQPNAPVIPGNQFTVQLNKVQNDVTAQQAQVQQAQQLTQINALPEVQAYQTAYANMQAAIAKGDPQAETDAANALNTAVVALQNSNNPLLQTAQGAQLAHQDIVQGQGPSQQYSGAEAAYQQQQAAQQSQLLAQQAAAAAATQNATNALNNDYKDLSKAQQAILGPISPTSSLTDVENTAQTAYQNALTAYQNNKSTDPTVTAQLAQNLQDAAYVNQVVVGDTQPYNNSAQVQTINAFHTAQSQNAQAQNTLDQYQVAQAAAAQQAANEAAQNSSPLGDLFSSIGSFVDNNIPGGWATIGAAALLAVGVTNPDLLGLADSGTLTPEAVTSAGVDPATVSTQIASGLTDGTIAPESVGLSTAPTISADGTITTVASDGATTTTAADGTVSTTAADGTVAPTTASGTASTGTVAPETGVPAETTPVAPDQTAALNTNQVGALSTPEPVPATPANTIPTTLPDGSVGSYDPATGTVYNADGSVNAAATNAAPNVGPGTEVAGPGGYDQKYTDLANAYQSNPSPENASALDEYLKSSGSDLTHNDFATFSSTTPEVPEVEMTSPVPPPETTPTETTPTNGGTTGTVDTTPVAPSETTGTTGGLDTSESTGGGSNWSPLTVGGQTLTADQVAGSLDALAAQQATIAASGLTAAQVAALGGAAAAVAAISSMGAGGATAAANSAIAAGAGSATGGATTTPVAPTTTTGAGTDIGTSGGAAGAGAAGAGAAGAGTGGTTPIAPVTTPTTEAPPPLTPLQTGPANANPVGSPVTTTYTDPSTGDPVDTTGMSAAQIAALVAAGLLASSLLQSTPSVPQQNALPIPTYSAQNLVNPGVNPGFIQPAPAYGYQGAGMDQYYWGQHQYAQNMNDLANLNAPAPATPYGQVSQLGQLITPQQLGYPTAQSMAAAGLPYNSQVSVLPQDVYNNTVQMNTATPAVPGFAGAYGPNTLAQQSAGQGQGQLYGQGLNYAFVPPVIPVAPANQ